MNRPLALRSGPSAAWAYGALTAGTAGLAATIGGDARWLAVAGRAVLAGQRPLSYAFAAGADWPPVLVGGEVTFRLLSLVPGDRGIQAAQAVAVAATTVLLVRNALRDGASHRAVAVGTVAVFLGAFTSFAITRVQLFSLPLFALTIVLLRAQTRRPSRGIWLLLPLTAVWSNLHGGVLVGVAAAAGYLLVHRARSQPRTAVGVFLGCLIALCLTPALWHTPRYYLGVANNELARQHLGLWAPLDPVHSPFDLMFLLVAVTMAVLAVRARPALWQLCTLLGLGILSIGAARNGVWFLLFGAGLAVRSTPAALPFGPASRRAVAAGVAMGLLLLTVALARGPRHTGATDALVDQAVELAAGSPVAAEGSTGEQVAARGGCVWVTNPFDAFPRSAQRSYLSWSAGDPAAALPRTTRVLLVRRGGPAAGRADRTPSTRLIATDRGYALYERRPPATSPVDVTLPAPSSPGGSQLPCR